MSYNLALPENAEKAAEARAQLQAGKWAYELRNRHVSRHIVKHELEAIEDVEHREAVRKWLNTYR